MSQYEFDDLLEKYLSGHCSPQEEKLVLAWYRSFIGETEINISAEEKQRIESRIWSNVTATVTSEEGEMMEVELETPVVRMWPRRIARMAIAGCLVLVSAGAWYWMAHRAGAVPKELFTQEPIPGGYVSVYNQENVAREVALSDGSQVKLESGSVIYYPPAFQGATREVYLSGNAFFDIAHDASRHFIVHTSEGVLAEVLGTSFYVSHDKATHKIEVAVVTGKVSVYERRKKNDTIFSASANSIIITPNQKVTYKTENNQFTTSLVDDPKPVTAPEQATTFDFEDASLDKVLKALEETYAISIETTDNGRFGHCHFTGDITKQDLYEKLDIICQSVQASYEVKGTTIYIKGKGCN
ncbi:FecR family protein [Chitinophaga arvensicola]|uniref:Ferric-dicitrate binding protein FerR, regulates iron transport through sigma-19 n=1 Tax=Chitinophaga arvensicola TaxID=29529 RepID=A0A1I0SBC4_9BACT|nr:FecR family protein [Chitinophaga arvensicola]SEW53982.1 ferric-dicitrate binding protein FerR, regulates iron transport through sigma-19 [Chitinophaga arvensicola]